MTEDSKLILDFLNCDCEVFEELDDDKELMSLYRQWTQIGQTEGYVPLIIVPSVRLSENLELFMEDHNINLNPLKIKKIREKLKTEALEFDDRSFLSERLAHYTDIHEGINLLGEFIELPESHSFYSYMSQKTKSPVSEIILARIPTRDPWELPLWIPMGDFNDCPGPVEQTAVFKKWYDRYRAFPGVVTSENWELEVYKPVKEPRAAEYLAREQFAFCYDIVMQGPPESASIRGLASGLINSTTWFFWWD